MSLLLSLRKRLIFPVLLAAFPNAVWSQVVAIPQGAETSLVGPRVGDQNHSSLSFDQNKGCAVWEENGSKKTAMQIEAAWFNSSLIKTSEFTANKVKKGDQVNPKIQLLKNGGAIIVWQNYGLGNADIYARILKPDGSPWKGDRRINSNSKKKGSYSKDQQSEPVICPLQDGGAFVVWQSLNQDGSMMGVYGRTVSESGALGDEVLINQTTAYSQRTPAVATLADGRVVVAWVSEFQRFGSTTDVTSVPSIDVYARIFDASGNAVTGEKLLNSGNNICANPAIAPLTNGGFTVVWSEKDAMSRSNSWEIMGRTFSAEGDALNADFKINTNTFGDQYHPEIAAVGEHCVVVWTSLGQDGSREGVFGRVLQSGQAPSGDEFQVNTTTVSQQVDPAVAALGNDRCVVTWSGFVAVNGFDLFAQRYVISQQQ